MPRRFLFRLIPSPIYQLLRDNLTPGERRALEVLERQVAKNPHMGDGRRQLPDGCIADDQTVQGMIVSWRVLDATSVEMDRVYVER